LVKQSNNFYNTFKILADVTSALLMAASVRNVAQPSANEHEEEC